MIQITANILIVDDSKVQVQMVKNVLEDEKHKVFVSYDGVGVIDTLLTENIDAVLMDVILPHTSGFELLQEVLSNDETMDIPVIMVTGLTTVDDVKKALDMGAFDYMKKPTEPMEIIARVNSAVRLKKKQDLLKNYASKDNLTMLYNRAYGDKLLSKVINNINEYEKGISFAIMDCDLFKQINDRFGHVFGDSVLSSIANSIFKSIKNTDIACRYGGEEFCITLPNTSLQEGFIICERVRNNIQKNKFNFNGDDVFVTISIGLTHMSSKENYNAIALISEADQALYVAKNRGRNRVEFWKK